MAKTLDDLYSKLDEILNSLSSLNDNITPEMGDGKDGGMSDEQKARHQKELENLETKKQVFDQLLQTIEHVHKRWSDMQDQAYKSGRALGYTGDKLQDYFDAQLENAQQLAHELGMSDKELLKIQDSYSNATNRAKVLTTEQLRFSSAMSKLVGEATVSTMTENMSKFGASSQTAMARLAKARNEAVKFGLNATKTSEAIAKNIKLASSYNFKGGTSELAKMVVESERMRVNFDSMAKASEKFNTLDSTISTSANIQVLGGSFAREFGNPLEVMYEATSDMGAFMDRIGRTLEGKGAFNKKTGEVQFDPVTRRILSEFGKQVGMSTEELITMASSKITHAEIKNAVKGRGFTKEQLGYLQGQATFNQDKQAWTINKVDKYGNSKEVDISTLSPDDIAEIQRNTISEENAFKDIKSIAANVAKMVGDSRSFQEIKTGADTQRDAYAAEGWDATGGALTNWLYAAGGGITSTALMLGVPWGKRRMSKYFADKKKAIDNKYKEPKTPKEPSPSDLSSQGKSDITDSKPKRAVGRGTLQRNTKAVMKRVMRKAKGKGKLVVGAGALLATVFGLSAASNGTSQEVNTQPNEVGSNGDPILDELKKHTEILSHMSGGIDKYSESSRSEEGGYGLGGAVGDLAVGLATDPYIATSLGIKALGSKLGQKTITNIAPKLASKLALGATTKALAGPLGWGGLAVDGINMLGQGMEWWEEDGAVAKTLDIGGSALTGAGIGATIGTSVFPVIGGAVGAAVGAGVGALVGVSDDIKEGLQSWDRKTTELLDSDSIGEKLLGGISWVGHTLAENSFPGMIAKLFGETEYDRQEEAWEKHMEATREQQEAWETQKLGQTSIGDPMLQQKAAYATIKTHDQIITWYRAYMGLNSDATDEVGELKKVEFEDVYRAHEKAKGSGEGFAEGGIVGGSSFSGDKLTAKVNSGEMILNANQQAKLFSLVASGPIGGLDALIKAKDIVGQPQFISPSAPTPAINSMPQTTSVNVNVNGTLKLESNNNSLQIDLAQLLNNPQFKQQIVDMVSQGLNERSNGAVRVNRNSPQAKSNGGIGKSSEIMM